LGAGIIGSPKNRSNPMQIINFHLGAGNRQGFSHRDADAKSLLDEAIRRAMGGAAGDERS
jgi:hypothetical protein